MGDAGLNTGTAATERSACGWGAPLESFSTEAKGLNFALSSASHWVGTVLVEESNCGQGILLGRGQVQEQEPWQLGKERLGPAGGFRQHARVSTAARGRVGKWTQLEQPPFSRGVLPLSLRPAID